MLLNLCESWISGFGNCIANGELAKLESSDKELGGSVEI